MQCPGDKKTPNAVCDVGSWRYVAVADQSVT